LKAKSKKFGPRLTVSLTGMDYNTLNALAEKDKVSISWVVRRAIDEYLYNHQGKLRPSLLLHIPIKGQRPAADQS
jgi:hypothetical protein